MDYLFQIEEVLLTASIPWQIWNGDKRGHKVIEGPGHDHAIVDIVVGDHHHGGYAHSCNGKNTNCITGMVEDSEKHAKKCISIAETGN